MSRRTLHDSRDAGEQIQLEEDLAHMAHRATL